MSYDVCDSAKLVRLANYVDSTICYFINSMATTAPLTRFSYICLFNNNNNYYYYL